MKPINHEGHEGTRSKTKTKLINHEGHEGHEEKPIPINF